MKRIYLNTRDELVVIDPNKLACVFADGNYSKLVYIDKRFPVSLTSFGISKIAEILQKAETNLAHPTFLRLGRSLIINQNYLIRISVPKQRIILSDRGENIHGISVPKQLLKQYKERFETVKRSEMAE